MSVCNSEVSVYFKVNRVFNNNDIKKKISSKNQSSC